MNSSLMLWLPSVISFAVVMCLTPGPNNAMVAASGANFGFRATIPHILGISIGFPVMVLAMALGAGNVLRAYPAIHPILKWVGAAYLLFLAFQIARSSRPVADEAGGKKARPITFVQAALFQWVNPKAWIIALGAIAAYTTPDGVFVQAFIVAGIFLIACIGTVSFWTLTGVGASRLLKSEQSLRRFNWVMAALLVASLAPLLLGD